MSKIQFIHNLIIHNMKNLILIIVTLTLVSLLSCSDDSQNTDQIKDSRIKLKTNNLNISILLDLSDRINPVKNPNKTLSYYQRDIGYINSIAKAFKQHLISKKVRKINDRIQMFVEPEPQNSKINSMLSELKIEFTKDNISKKSLSEIETKYNKISSEIYNTAIVTKEYPGSDIWGFMKYKVNDYCIKDKYRNILIILTDGYMYHENNVIKGNRSSYLLSRTIKKYRLNKNDWQEKIKKNNYGFIKVNDNLNNLEVLVLGINPSKNNPFEFDVIKTYWSNWFKEMGVKKFDIKQADLPSQLDEFINNFINN